MNKLLLILAVLITLVFILIATVVFKHEPNPQVEEWLYNLLYLLIGLEYGKTQKQ